MDFNAVLHSLAVADNVRLAWAAVAVLAVLCLVLAVVTVNRQAALTSMRDAERSFRDLYESINEGVFRSTLGGRMISANPALVRLNGFATEEEMLNEVNDIAGRWYVDPNRRSEIHHMLMEHGQVSGVVSEVYRYKTRERIWIEEHTRLVRDSRTGMPHHYDGTVREVTETMRRLQLQERFEKIASVTDAVLYQHRLQPDGSSQILYASGALGKIFGIDPNQVVDDASILLTLVHPDDREALAASYRRATETMTARKIDYRIRTPAGVEKWVSGHSVPEREPDGSILWHGYIADVTEQKAAEGHIHRLAYVDPLTGLPNRVALIERLRDALARSEATGDWGAVLFIDLDQFKILNDTKGHHVGDRLLAEVAGRVKTAAGEGRTISRLGGDEFVILIQEPGDREQAAEAALALARQVLEAVARPYLLDGFPFHTSASIGVAPFQGTAEEPEEHLKRADLAMYHAKAAGRGSVCFFAPEMQAAADERLAIGNELRDALEEGQLTLAYQPQVDNGGRTFGVEALLRWVSPTRGDMKPGDFIPLAERAGLSGLIDSYVLRIACTTLRRWAKNPATRDLTVAVNISARRLRSEFVESLSRVLGATGIDPKLLILELTETVMLDNSREVAEVMAGVKALGVAIALDDFGTGYSSLSNLKRLPIDVLKVDLSFVRDLESDPNDRVIVQTILNVAHNLGMSAIAEGVETEVQALLLRQYGCRAYQGFLFGRPMALDEFEAWIGRAAAAPDSSVKEIRA